jgi:hypothetical protein
LGGVVVSTLFGVQFILWQLANWSRLHDIDADPTKTLVEIWIHLRLALLGVAIFFLAWLWALTTSLAIVRASRKAEGTQSPRF